MIFKLPDGTSLDVSDDSLISGHPDLKPQSPDAAAPRYVPARSFHNPPAMADDWRTAKAPEPTGYSSPVEDPEYLKRIQYKGGV